MEGQLVKDPTFFGTVKGTFKDVNVNLILTFVNVNLWVKYSQNSWWKLEKWLPDLSNIAEKIVNCCVGHIGSFRRLEFFVVIFYFHTNQVTLFIELFFEPN
mgnify:CR=1 FL=1